jgi:hypothetical protein
VRAPEVRNGHAPRLAVTNHRRDVSPHSDDALDTAPPAGAGRFQCVWISASTSASAGGPPTGTWGCSRLACAPDHPLLSRRIRLPPSGWRQVRGHGAPKLSAGEKIPRPASPVLRRCRGIQPRVARSRDASRSSGWSPSGEPIYPVPAASPHVRRLVPVWNPSYTEPAVDAHLKVLIE